MKAHRYQFSPGKWHVPEKSRTSSKTWNHEIRKQNHETTNHETMKSRNHKHEITKQKHETMKLKSRNHEIMNMKSRSWNMKPRNHEVDGDFSLHDFMVSACKVLTTCHLLQAFVKCWTLNASSYTASDHPARGDQPIVQRRTEPHTQPYCTVQYSSRREFGLW